MNFKQYTWSFENPTFETDDILLVPTMKHCPDFSGRFTNELAMLVRSTVRNPGLWVLRAIHQIKEGADSSPLQLNLAAYAAVSMLERPPLSECGPCLPTVELLVHYHPQFSFARTASMCMQAKVHRKRDCR
jgi:hypothetical protein